MDRVKCFSVGRFFSGTLWRKLRLYDVIVVVYFVLCQLEYQENLMLRIYSSFEIYQA